MADFWAKDAVVAPDTGSGQRDLGGADVPQAIAPTPTWAAKDKPVSAGQSMSDRILNLSTGAGYGAASGLQNVVNDAKLVSAGGYTLLQQPDIADQIFADVAKGREAQTALERTGNAASPIGQMGGQLASVILQAPLAEATLPERLAVEGAPLTVRAAEAIKRGFPLASLLGQEQAQNQALTAGEAGASPGQALGVYGTALPINTAANLVPMGMPGNLPTRAITGAVLGGAAGLGANEAQHLATPDFAAAPTLESALPQAGIGAILNVITGGKARAAEPFGGGKPLEEPAGPLALPSPEAVSPREAAAAAPVSPAPAAPVVAPKAPAPVDPVAAFHADPRSALATLDHGTLTQLASDAGVDVPAKADTGTVLDALAKLPAATLQRDVLPEYLDAVKAQGAAAPIVPPAEPTPSMKDLVLPSSVAVTKGGEAFTPEQGAATIAQAIAEKQAAGPGLPSPMTIVDRAGNAMDSAAFLRQANQAADQATAERQAASDRTNLGLTPDIERTQGQRWAANDAANRASAQDLANRQADQQAMADHAEPSELATQGADDTPPWWLAGQHAEAEHAADQRQAIEPLRSEIGWDTVGGKVLRDAESGDVTGRTPWVGKAGPMGESLFWRERPTEGSRITESQANMAMDKYQAGKPLNAREQRFIDYAQATQRGYDADFRQSLRELAQERLDARDTDLAAERDAVQRASIDPADHDEALTLAQLVRRAYDAGATPEAILGATFHGEPAEHARALWDLTRQLEQAHGPDREGLDQAGARDAAAADQGQEARAQAPDRAGEPAAATPAVNASTDLSQTAVTDKDGQPLTVYHGGTAAAGKHTAPAFFSEDRSGAEWYAEDRGGKVTAAQLDIRQPLDLRSPEAIDQLVQTAHDAGVQTTGDWREGDFHAPEIGDHSPYDGTAPTDLLYIPKVRDALEAQGYDGARLDDTLENGTIPAWVAFHPEQIHPAADKVKQPAGDLFAAPTARERLNAESAKRDAARNGLGRDLVRPEQGAGELLAGPKPRQAELEHVDDASRELSIDQGNADADRMGLREAVNQALGPAADKVEFLHGYEGLPDGMRERTLARNAVSRKGNTVAMYSPSTGRVFIFTDRVRTPAQAVWSAAHEIAGHEGLRALLGDKLDPVLGIARKNPTVKALADAIHEQRNIAEQMKRAGRSPGEGHLLATEEALAELAAAVRTGNYEHIKERYGVEVPPGIRERVKAAINDFLQRLKAMLADLFGKHTFTDADVRDLLESAWQAVQRRHAARKSAADDIREEVGDTTEPPMSLTRVREVLAERGMSQDRIDAMSKDELRAEQANLRRRSPPTEAEVRDERLEKATEPTGTVTGIKNATVDEERALAGKNAIEHDLKRSNPQAFATAKERLANEPAYGRDLAAELVDRPRPHTQEEAMALILDRVRISNERREAYTTAAKAQESGDPLRTADALERVRKLDAQMELNDQAARLSGHETGAALQARRVLAKEDYSMAALVNRGKVAAGRPLKDTERAALEAKALEIEKREAELARREAALRETRATPKPPREKKAAQDKFSALVDQLRTIAKQDQLKKGCVI